MFKETLARLKENPFDLKITGKGLIYNVDLKGSIRSDKSELIFMLAGKIRFGILKSQGEFISRYQVKEDNVTFLDQLVEFPKIFFKERHRASDNSLSFQKNKGELKDVKLVDPVIMDPLPLIFKLLTLESNEDISFGGYLLLSGKQKSFSFNKKDNDFVVEVEGKPSFEGQVLPDEVAIKISKLKVDLAIRRN